MPTEPTKPPPRLFKYRHFEASLILLCLRWYLRYSLSYRDLEEMMIERGFSVDHTCPGYLSHPRSRYPPVIMVQPTQNRQADYPCLSPASSIGTRCSFLHP